MRAFVSLVLAVLMAVLAYAGFWWFSLSYNAREMRGSVEQALGGSLTYGNPQWVPEAMAVKVRWPGVHLQMASGPVREVVAPDMVMVSGFLSKDRWTLQLPAEVEMRMANGSRLFLQTKGGQIVLLEAPSRLAFRADDVTVLNGAREVLAHVGDVMVERSPSDEGVRLNLASRPDWGGGEAVLSGQVVLPTSAATALLASFGDQGVPSFGEVLQRLTARLMADGGTATLDNISFRIGDMSGAIYGTLQVVSNGEYAGSLAVTADSPARLLQWIAKAGVVGTRSMPERLGWMDVRQRIAAGNASLRIEVMPGGLLLNGAAVGPVPKVADVVARLWQ